MRKLVISISFFYSILLGQSDIDNAAKYTLNLNREAVRSAEVTSLIINVKLIKDFFIYSTDPEKTLSPTAIEWEDSSFFDVVGILHEPEPKIKYDPMFEMNIGYHSNLVQFKQDLQISQDLKR